MSKDQLLVDAIIEQRNNAMNTVATLQAELGAARLELAKKTEELSKALKAIEDLTTEKRGEAA